MLFIVQFAFIDVKNYDLVSGLLLFENFSIQHIHISKSSILTIVKIRLQP